MSRRKSVRIPSLFLPPILLLIASGCRGPLAVPMVERLDSPAQAKVDGVWGVLLDSQAPVDRTLLLDIVLLHQLHQLGVDSLHLTSTKRVADGYIEMQVRFERDQPELDEFSVTHFHADGREIRRERYARADIEERIAFFTGSTMVDETATPEAREAQEHRNAERDARMQEIEALVRPIIDANNPSPAETAPDAPFPLVIMPNG